MQYFFRPGPVRCWGEFIDGPLLIGASFSCRAVEVTVAIEGYAPNRLGSVTSIVKTGEGVDHLIRPCPTGARAQFVHCPLAELSPVPGCAIQIPLAVRREIRIRSSFIDGTK